MTLKEIRSTAKLANPILVSNGIALLRSEQRVGVKSGKDATDLEGKEGPVGPTELYSTRTGLFIRRLDRPGCWLSHWKISPDKRWLIYTEESVDEPGKRQAEKAAPHAVIVSTADGRELARLEHSGLGESLDVEISPTGKWVITDRGTSLPAAVAPLHNYRLWNTTTWQSVKDAAFDEAVSKQGKYDTYCDFITDDLLGFGSNFTTDGNAEGIIRIGTPGSWIPEKSVKFAGPELALPISELGGTLLRQGRVLFTSDPIKRIKQPAGRKYAAELVKLAPDGRFFENLDTVTEKDLPFLPYGWAGTYIPGYGRAALRMYDEDPGLVRNREEPDLYILPDQKRLNIPPEMLELWAKIVVGGELSTEGTFQPWDQPTWATKQRELAAMKPPYADFPFPGWAATEPNLWYRIRANDTKAGRDRDKLLEQWRRTQPPRPDLGPDTWRTPEVIPPPRESK